MFDLISDYIPVGDQIKAIKTISNNILKNKKHQTLLGVTGSGKTFTIANVIFNVQKPILILAHNKTLAAQLYIDFKNFFPKNLVCYYVSNYDYYRPEAYLPKSKIYIEKEVYINQELERFGLFTINSLLSNRKDIIVISSVSCIYGVINPNEFKKNIIVLKKGLNININTVLYKLVKVLYVREKNTGKLLRGNFRVNGDSLDIFLSHCESIIRLHFFDDNIELIQRLDISSKKVIENLGKIEIYPANIFTVSYKTLKSVIEEIKLDLSYSIKKFKNKKKYFEAKRLIERVNYDIEMMKEMGYCPGIENYSRYFDGRDAGDRPFCLIDYFPKDYIMIIDESHVTLPQFKSMYKADLSRKINLVNNGYRLPSSLDNRPLNFLEFECLQNQVIYVSATPSEYEFKKSKNFFVEQIIRPTGLLNPLIQIHSNYNYIDHLICEIKNRILKNERVLIITLTKIMAEKINNFFIKLGIKSNYIHSDIKNFKRLNIIQKFREGFFDVLIGVNLLREGLDLPEVSLVAILDADKEGFLRSYKSLIQIIGRVSRNVNGMAIFYADKITNGIRKTIIENNKQRNKQIIYNKKNKLIPKSLVKKTSINLNYINSYVFNKKNKVNLPIKDLKIKIKFFEKLMKKAAFEQDFVNAAIYRDKVKEFKSFIN